MKIMIRILTGIAAIVLLFLGAATEVTTTVCIIAGICIAWLALVGFATLRRRTWKEN